MSPEKNPVDHEIDDDDALNWGESADSSYVEGPARARRGGETAADADDDDEDELPEGVLSSGMLVVHGVFAALFLLYTVAWLKSISTVQPSLDGALADGMWRVGTWLAVAAPAFWFVATVWLTPTSASRKRVLSFVAAAILLIPWPFVIGNFS